jgi:hypothetical protein
MTQKDCVSLYVDIFKWGALILTLTIGWFLSNQNMLDWPESNTSAHYAVRIAYLAFSAVFWFGWADVLDRIRAKSIAASPATGDFLAEIGFGYGNWVLCVVALGISWYVVFDDHPLSVPSGLALAGLIALPTVAFARKWSRARSPGPALRIPA